MTKCGCGGGRHCERGWELFREAERLRDEATDDSESDEKWKKALKAKQAYNAHMGMAKEKR